MAVQTRPVAQPATAPSLAARRAAERAVSAPADGSRWFQLAVLALVAGGLAAGVAGIAGHPEWQPPAAGAGVGLAAIALGSALRARSRRRRIMLTAERIVPLLGRPDLPIHQLAQLVRARWPLGTRPAEPPRRVMVRPPAACPLSDPALLERIADTAGRAFGIHLRVGTVHRRRHELVLVPARLEAVEVLEAVQTVEAAPREIRCAEIVIEQRLGSDAEIVGTAYGTDDGHSTDDGQRRLDSLDVRFTPTAQNTEPRFWVGFDAAFNRQVPGRWHASTDLVADLVTKQARCHIQRRPTLPTRIPYELDLLAECDEREIPYAVDEHCRPVTWSLTYSPHMLVSGAARSGKSSTLRAIVRGFVGRGWPALVCDPRRTGLLGMRGWPGVQALATSAETPHMVAIVEHVHHEMNRRYAAVEAGLTRKGRLEPLLLVLDEFRELQEEIGLWWAGEGAAAVGKRRSSEPPVFDLIGSIARLGGEVEVHLLIGIKRPDVDGKFLPEDLRENCRSRCSHGALTREEAQVMWANAAIGRSVPPMIQGRGTALRADGTPGEVQALWLPDPLGLEGADVELYQRLEPPLSTHPWLKPVEGGLVETHIRPITPWAEPIRYAPATDIAAEDAWQTGEGAWDRVEPDIDEWDGRYGDQEVVPAGDVREADLLEVEDGSNVWVVVDHIAADPDEPDLLYIDGRVIDSGLPKTVIAAEDALIPRRQQVTGP